MGPVLLFGMCVCVWRGSIGWSAWSRELQWIVLRMMPKPLIGAVAGIFCLCWSLCVCVLFNNEKRLLLTFLCRPITVCQLNKSSSRFKIEIEISVVDRMFPVQYAATIKILIVNTRAWMKMRIRTHAAHTKEDLSYLTYFYCDWMTSVKTCFVILSDSVYLFSSSSFSSSLVPLFCCCSL